MFGGICSEDLVDCTSVVTPVEIRGGVGSRVSHVGRYRSNFERLSVCREAEKRSVDVHGGVCGYIE